MRSTLFFMGYVNGLYSSAIFKCYEKPVKLPQLRIQSK
jgi:hypothetical protein